MKIQFDKFMHALLCFIIALMAGFTLIGLGCPLAGCLVGGAMPALVAGLVKEWTDKDYGNKFDYKDLIADVVGIVLAVAVLAMIIILDA